MNPLMNAYVVFWRHNTQVAFSIHLLALVAVAAAAHAIYLDWRDNRHEQR